MPLEAVLPYFRSVVPGVAGVVMASADGHALAGDVGADAEAVAQRAVGLHREASGRAPLEDAALGASVFVPCETGVVLVVFVEAATPAAADGAIAVHA